MKYAVNSEGVEAMKSTATSVSSSLEEIEGLTGRLRSSASEHSDSIGPHQASLEEALEQIDQSVRTASEPANGVAERLNEIALAYEEIISNDLFVAGRYTDSENGDSQKSIGAKTLRR